jgi:hypothetical protein
MSYTNNIEALYLPSPTRVSCLGCGLWVVDRDRGSRIEVGMVVVVVVVGSTESTLVPHLTTVALCRRTVSTVNIGTVEVVSS